MTADEALRAPSEEGSSSSEDEEEEVAKCGEGTSAGGGGGRHSVLSTVPWAGICVWSFIALLLGCFKIFRRPFSIAELLWSLLAVLVGFSGPCLGAHVGQTCCGDGEQKCLLQVAGLKLIFLVTIMYCWVVNTIAMEVCFVIDVPAEARMKALGAINAVEFSLLFAWTASRFMKKARADPPSDDD